MTTATPTLAWEMTSGLHADLLVVHGTHVIHVTRGEQIIPTVDRYHFETREVADWYALHLTEQRERHVGRTLSGPPLQLHLDANVLVDPHVQPSHISAMLIGAWRTATAAVL